MNDQIKDFVNKNREEFDHLEAPAFDMERFKRTRVPQSRPKFKIVSLFNKAKWVIAASVMIAVGIVWFSFYQQKPTLGETYSQNKAAKSTDERDENKTLDSSASATDTKNEARQVTFAHVNKVEKMKIKALTPEKQLQEYQALKDSSSASVRLLAILEIEKSGKVSNQVLDMLSQTLNHDGNTNVRLAALGVLQKYSFDGYASSLLVNSLSRQDDPIVQLGLINLLGKMKNVKIDEKLYAIANNPETFAAVRDEAYNVLLNQDKL
ncbi:HEAT repeat domain-containing protein [Pedobacter chinensis]|uniref:HEAT repeat domain-containing protein n=1 Tax=Pedobacter chinensis TaxID=2282421 RepID=A0A369PTW9_9SPHI|nr:HEAT repeat domain-containing protein [Pedobacter chinensis]RDC55974.1 HEAT repeat domain-containing protein [Pedobacter chinensis]